METILVNESSVSLADNVCGIAKNFQETYSTSANLNKQDRSDSTIMNSPVPSTISAVLICPCCNRKFLSSEEMIRHVKSSPVTLKAYTCSLCQVEFLVPSELKQHKEDVHNIKQIKFKCDECDIEYNTPTLLARHKRHHEEIARLLAAKGIVIPKSSLTSSGPDGMKYQEHADRENIAPASSLERNNAIHDSDVDNINLTLPIPSLQCNVKALNIANQQKFDKPVCISDENDVGQKQACKSLYARHVNTKVTPVTAESKLYKSELQKRTHRLKSNRVTRQTLKKFKKGCQRPRRKRSKQVTDNRKVKTESGEDIDVPIDNGDHDLEYEPSDDLYYSGENQCADVSYSDKQDDQASLMKEENIGNKQSPDLNDFSCPDCGILCLSLNGLTRHRLNHFKEGVSLNCIMCPATFDSRRAMLSHMNGKHPQKKIREKLFCGEAGCNLVFEQMKKLLQHKLKDHGLSRFAVNTCPDCGKQYPSRSTLIRHARIHNGDRPYKCDFCPMTYTNSSNLLSHRRKHTKETPYFCAVCRKGFLYSNDLRRHEILHTGAKPWTCEICGEKFALRSYLLHHTRKYGHSKTPIDKESPRHICPICNRGFIVTIKYQMHVAQHSEIREKLEQSDGQSYVCEVCGRTYAFKSSLRTHMYMHTASPSIKCRHCDKSFRSYKIRLLHEKKHGGKEHTCSECGKTFLDLYNLKQHLRRHTFHHDWLCNICGKTYTCKRDLQRHVANHGLGKQYVCPYCPKDFKYSSHYQRHVDSHERKEFNAKKSDLTRAQNKKEKIIKNRSPEFHSKFSVHNPASSELEAPTGDQPLINLAAAVDLTLDRQDQFGSYGNQEFNSILTSDHLQQTSELNCSFQPYTHQDLQLVSVKSVLVGNHLSTTTHSMYQSSSTVSHHLLTP